ncbi:MAG: hypothetical protein JJU30_11325 [Alkalimonas sp.]|nr:hypothetical protein [Alkalimonas sp.]
MKTLIKIVVFVVVLPIALVGVILHTMAGGMCANEVHAEIISPNQRYKAVIFQRDCGATTDFSTQISILKAEAKLPNKSGNIFVARGHPEHFPHPIRWLSNTELFIEKELNGSEFKAEQSWGRRDKFTVSYAAGSS